MAKCADLGLRTRNIDENTTFTHIKQKSNTLARCSMMLSTVGLHTSSGFFFLLLYFNQSERLNVKVGPRDRTRMPLCSTQSHNINETFTHMTQEIQYASYM